MHTFSLLTVDKNKENNKTERVKRSMLPLFIRCFTSSGYKERLTLIGGKKTPNLSTIRTSAHEKRRINIKRLLFALHPLVKQIRVVNKYKSIQSTRSVSKQQPQVFLFLLLLLQLRWIHSSSRHLKAPPSTLSAATTYSSAWKRGGLSASGVQFQNAQRRKTIVLPFLYK